MAQVYELRITQLAQKELASLDKQNYIKVKDAIYALAQNPRPVRCKKLKNRDAWRIRCGNYRVIYEIHDDKVVVIVIRIAHRKEVYR
ncbi:MAG TPA: type II toxin-antitoxin system RelE/ParE family toxin [Nitrospirae bacterium]|nr:type II toxin-antitoxin system RelE/ParE family toxin [Nitrospirota bacterium]